MKAMKDRAIIANSGHFDNEIDMGGLEEQSTQKRTMRTLFDEYTLGEKKLYVCGEGRLVNLSCAEGHPSEVMSLSFCGQALACEYLVKNKATLKPGLHTLPESIDQEISTLQLAAMGISIDTLTAEQSNYLQSWNEGT
jgi:adenosylhomocysteinase